MIAGNLNGLFAPAGVPRPIVDRIADATRKIMADADIQRILVTSGFEPILNSGSSDPFVAGDARWTPIMEEAAFKLYEFVRHVMQGEPGSRSWSENIHGSAYSLIQSNRNNHGARPADPGARPSRARRCDRAMPPAGAAS